MIETLTNNAAFLHWTLAIGITLLVLDLFCNTEVIAWIALFCFATWATLLTGAPVQWSLLIFLLYLAAAAALYYAVWSVFIRPFVVGLMLRHSPAEDDQLLIGRHGTIIGEGDDMHLRVADELWPVEEHSRASLKPGDTATITGYHNGIVTVRPQQPELENSPSPK